jgi:hypothetical protein
MSLLCRFDVRIPLSRGAALYPFGIGLGHRLIHPTAAYCSIGKLGHLILFSVEYQLESGWRVQGLFGFDDKQHAVQDVVDFCDHHQTEEAAFFENQLFTALEGAAERPIFKSVVAILTDQFMEVGGASAVISHATTPFQLTCLNPVCRPSKNTLHDQSDAVRNFREWHYICVFGRSGE